MDVSMRNTTKCSNFPVHKSPRGSTKDRLLCSPPQSQTPKGWGAREIPQSTDEYCWLLTSFCVFEGLSRVFLASVTSPSLQTCLLVGYGQPLLHPMTLSLTLICIFVHRSVGLLSPDSGPTLIYEMLTVLSLCGCITLFELCPWLQVGCFSRLHNI